MQPHQGDQDLRDHAYWVCEHWGPHLRIPVLTRLRAAFPSVSDDTFSSWLEEFKVLDAEIWRLASAGGPVVLGTDAVRNTLQSKFPWLVEEGLKHAMFVTAYFAWHEGYDKDSRLRTDP